jgi:hypothetical protein
MLLPNARRVFEARVFAGQRFHVLAEPKSKNNYDRPVSISAGLGNTNAMDGPRVLPESGLLPHGRGLVLDKSKAGFVLF